VESLQMNADDLITDQSAKPADTQNLLDAFEVRVLAVLAEKEALTPDTYPLTVNALTNGCNQLSSRDPVMAISDATVQDVLDRLVQRELVAEVSQAGARANKYERRMRIKWTLEQDKLCILTVLMLRGVQTAGEIRSRIGRMHEFASVADVETGLQFLIDKYPPVVGRLARAPGAKESRYAHLLSGEEILERQEILSSSVADRVTASSRADRIEQLEQEVSRLRDAFASLTQEFEQFKKQFE
jgi:uncharacterized protein YceH (UPF0502 family)